MALLSNARRRRIGSAAASIALAVLATTSCARPATREVSELAVPNRANATASIAAAGDAIAVAWGATDPDGRADVYVAVSRDRARTFGEPVRVNKVEGEARLSGEVPPRVAIARPTAGAAPQVVVLWTAKTPATEIKIATSHDGGQHFGGEQSLQAPAAAGDRGWPSLAIDENGAAHAVWLDHRGLAGGQPGGDHHGHVMGTSGSSEEPHDPVAMAQGSGLYFASLDGSSERELVKGVCYCCKTALVSDAGALFAAWRQVYPGGIRDIAFTSSRDAGGTFAEPVRVSVDNWKLDGCPDDGPAMAVDAGHVVHIVWPTLLQADTAEPEGALFYASTRDGRTFTPRQRIPTLGSPKPTHPQIATSPEGRIFIAWDEMQDKTRKAIVREVHTDANGASTFGPPIVLNADAAASYPMLAAVPGGIVAVWTKGAPQSSSIAVRVLSVD